MSVGVMDFEKRTAVTRRDLANILPHWRLGKPKERFGPGGNLKCWDLVDDSGVRKRDHMTCSVGLLRCSHKNDAVNKNNKHTNK